MSRRNRIAQAQATKQENTTKSAAEERKAAVKEQKAAQAIYELQQKMRFNPGFKIPTKAK